MAENLLDLGGYSNLPTKKIITDSSIGEMKLLVGERADNETAKQVLWCNEFLRMGLKRSLTSLYYAMHEEYLQTSSSDGTSDNMPALNTIRKWSGLFEWDRRAEQYDNITENHRQRQIWQVTQSELIHSWGRVLKLLNLEKTLLGVIDQRGPDGEAVNLWVTHKGAKTFNGQLLTHYRGLLDDIAKEVGGRKTETAETMFSTPEDSMPTIDPSTLSDEELKMFSELLDKANMEDHEDIIIDVEAEEDNG